MFYNIFYILMIYNISFIFSKLELKFKKRIQSNLNEDNIMSNLFINDLYTNLKIGTPNQEIPITLKLQNHPFYIISNKSNYTKSKIYNEKISSSYNFIKTIPMYFTEEDMLESNLATENIIFNDNINIEKLTFVLGTQLNPYRNIYEGGSIGLKIHYDNFESLKGINLINNLKKINKINSYSFSLEFNKDDDLNLIIGNLPHEYNKKYSKENLKTCNVIYNGINPEWILKFDEIKYNKDYLSHSKNFWLYPELGVIISTSDFKEYMNKTFFQNYVSKNICFQKLYSDHFINYYYFYCKESLNIDNLGKLSLYHKDLNYTFEIEFKDLFYQFKNFKYFLILFPENISVDWKLGLPFFRKYNLFVFDIDKKIIGIYRKNNWFTFSIWHLLFIALIIVIIIMGGVIYYLLSKKQRKIRANELEEQFEYLSYK